MQSITKVKSEMNEVSNYESVGRNAMEVVGEWKQGGRKRTPPGVPSDTTLTLRIMMTLHAPLKINNRGWMDGYLERCVCDGVKCK